MRKSPAPPSPTWRPLRTSRSTLNSSPRKKRRKISPISATKSVTSDGATRWMNSGSFGPRMIPARRYAGIAERPNRLATRPRMPSSAIVRASSASVMQVHSSREPDALPAAKHSGARFRKRFSSRREPLADQRPAQAVLDPRLQDRDDLITRPNYGPVADQLRHAVPGHGDEPRVLW